MITSVCEITARITNKSGVYRDISVACPVFDDKQLRVFRVAHYDKVPFVEGIVEKIVVSLKGWLPDCLIEISARSLPPGSYVTCGDSPQEIVRDIIGTLLNQLI